MSRTLALGLLLILPVLAACDRGEPPGAPPSAEAQRLNAAIESRLGGADTCVVLADTATGAVRYQYGRYDACNRPMPPCSTFKIANSLIGLDAGLVTPSTVKRWDGKPQPVKIWERDTDMTNAFRRSVVWWYQDLARTVGPQTYRERLKAYGYGSQDPKGPVDAFWLGPQAGGGLTITPRQQAAFLHRFYAGRLPVKPESAAAVQAMMQIEDVGGVQVSGKTGSCPSSADGSRQAGWWAGRLKGPARDLVVVAAMEGPEALPGAEVQDRMISALGQTGYLPAR